MKIDCSEYDDKHAAFVESLNKELNAIYSAIIRQAVKYGLSVNFDASKGEIFDFGSFPKLKKRVEQLFADMQSQILALVQNGIVEEWQLAEDKNDYLLEELLASTSLAKGRASAQRLRRSSWESGTRPPAPPRRHLSRPAAGSSPRASSARL